MTASSTTTPTDDMWMQRALELAETAVADQGEVPVGCVFVNDNNVDVEVDDSASQQDEKVEEVKSFRKEKIVMVDEIEHVSANPSPRDTVASYHVKYGEETENPIEIAHKGDKTICYTYSAPSQVYDHLPGHRQMRPYVKNEDERVRVHEGKTSSDGIRIAATCDLGLMRFENGDQSYYDYQNSGAAFDRALRAHMGDERNQARSRSVGPAPGPPRALTRHLTNDVYDERIRQQRQRELYFDEGINAHAPREGYHMESMRRGGNKIRGSDERFNPAGQPYALHRPEAYDPEALRRLGNCHLINSKN